MSDRPQPRPVPLTRADTNLLRKHARELRGGSDATLTGDLLTERLESLEALAAAIEKQLDSGVRQPLNGFHIAHLEDEARVLGGSDDPARRRRGEQLTGVLRKLGVKVGPPPT